MRRTLPALLSTTLALLACFTLARAAAATFNDTVEGSQTASGEGEGVAMNLNATGDLPGILTLSLKHEGGKVTGGSWTLTVLPPDADATSNERGRLAGSFTGGALTLDENGIVTAADSVLLTVQSGTGQFAGVSGGGATLSLSPNPRNPTKLGGPLVFNF
jgi:hypothetical protein